MAAAAAAAEQDKKLFLWPRNAADIAAAFHQNGFKANDCLSCRLEGI